MSALMIKSLHNHTTESVRAKRWCVYKNKYFMCTFELLFNIICNNSSPMFYFGCANYLVCQLKVCIMFVMLQEFTKTNVGECYNSLVNEMIQTQYFKIMLQFVNFV